MKLNFSRLIAGSLSVLLLLSACGKDGASSSAPDASSSAVRAETPDYSLGMTDDGFYEGYNALDCVKLPEGYDRIPSDDEFVTVTEEDLQAAIDDFMSSFASDVRITDRAVEKGDYVNIDYVGYIDGVAFEGGDTRGAGADYTAGSRELIDDFLDQIIGVRPGETVDVRVTFPTPYQRNAELSGKEAVFTTTVNYIHGSDVPELTEEFVDNYLSLYYGYTSVDDMREKLRAELLKERQFNYVLDWLYVNSEFVEVPAGLVDDQISLLRQEFDSAAGTYGVIPDELAAWYGAEDEDELLEAYRPSLENLVKQNLMTQAVALDAGIEVDEDAVTAYLADMDITNLSAAYENYGKGYIYQGVRLELVARYLIDHMESK